MELLELLREAYRRIPQDRLGKAICIDYDPAGSTYEFEEYEWSKEIRKLLNITFEPTGI